MRGSSARPDPALVCTNFATDSSQKSFAVRKQQTLFDHPKHLSPGCMDDAALVRETVARSIRKCHKSRSQIADEITRLTGRKLKEGSLNNFTARARSDYRWPAELDRAFAAVTGDDAILRCRAELAGYHLVDDGEYELLSLGREYLRQKRAGQQLELLAKRLAGVDL